MPRRGKRYKDAKSKLTVGDKLPPQDAIQIVKDLSFAKFDETVEVAARLGVDPRQADQVVRGTVSLPHGTGKDVRVLVIAQGEKEKEAQDAGADFVGVEYLEQIQKGWVDFDVAVATPDLMGKVGPLGRILGPRGLMPTPKAGTVTFDIGKAVTGDQGREDRIPGGPDRKRARSHREGVLRGREAPGEPGGLHGLHHPGPPGVGQGDLSEGREHLQHHGPRRRHRS